MISKTIQLKALQWTVIVSAVVISLYATDGGIHGLGIFMLGALSHMIHGLADEGET